MLFIIDFSQTYIYYILGGIMKISKIVSLLSFLIILFFGLNSCSIVGFYIGKSTDIEKLNIIDKTTREIYKLEPGTKIIVHMLNGDTLYGKFLDMERIPEEEYSEKYMFHGYLCLPWKCDNPHFQDTWLPPFSDALCRFQ